VQGEEAGHLSLGVIYNCMREYDHAFSEMDQVIDRNPKMPIAYFVRALARLDQGDAERAVADLDETIKLKPDWGLAYAKRGDCHEKKGDHPSAIVDFTEAVRLEPDVAQRFYQRGQAYEKLNDKTKAIADYMHTLVFDLSIHDNAKFQEAARNRVKVLELGETPKQTSAFRKRRRSKR
jgi:tetratricopeptide (TPR) repeat protein